MSCATILKICNNILLVGLTRAEAIHVYKWCSCQKKTETDAQLESELIKLYVVKHLTFNFTILVKQFQNNLSQNGDYDIKLVPLYKYLGLVLNEHLDYQLMAKVVAKSANRALGLRLQITK